MLQAVPPVRTSSLPPSPFGLYRLSDDLAKGKYIVTRPVNYQRPNFNTIITKSHTDLSRFLKEDFPHLDYSGESKTGTQLLRINQSLKLKNVTAFQRILQRRWL